MNDPQTWWLNLTNVLMGGGVLVFLLVIAARALYESLRHHGGSRTF